MSPCGHFSGKALQSSPCREYSCNSPLSPPFFTPVVSRYDFFQSVSTTVFIAKWHALIQRLLCPLIPSPAEAIIQSSNTHANYVFRSLKVHILDSSTETPFTVLMCGWEIEFLAGFVSLCAGFYSVRHQRSCWCSQGKLDFLPPFTYVHCCWCTRTLNDVFSQLLFGQLDFAVTVIAPLRTKLIWRTWIFCKMEEKDFSFQKYESTCGLNLGQILPS